MARRTHEGPAVLTANTLLAGDIVFWTGAGWTASIRAAQRAENDEARAALEAVGKAEEAANRVVGAYLVTLDPITGEPAALRERRRLAGPSIALPVNRPRAA